MFCCDCGTKMRIVHIIFDHLGVVLGTLYQCQKCKRIEYEQYDDSHMFIVGKEKT